MASDRPHVRNAADPQQVKGAARRAREVEELRRAAYAAVMSTEAGRLVMWDLLDAAGVYRSVWSPNSEIHYKAGQQDFGHMIMAMLLDVNEGLYELMGREARTRARKADTTAAAEQTRPAETEGESE